MVPRLCEVGEKQEEARRGYEDDVRLRRDENAIFKHVKDTEHTIDWEDTVILEQESK